MDDPITSALLNCYYDCSAVNWNSHNTEVTVDPDRFMALVLWWGWKVKVPHRILSRELAIVSQIDAYYHSCDVYEWSIQTMAWLVFGTVFDCGYRKGLACPIPKRSQASHAG